jgi:hypothetical protein
MLWPKEMTTDAIQTLDRITTRKQVAPQPTVKAFNPVAREDHQLFQVLFLPPRVPGLKKH